MEVVQQSLYFLIIMQLFSLSLRILLDSFTLLGILGLI